MRARAAGLFFLAAAAGSPAAAEPGLAQEIYLSTGEHGEASFSDVAAPGAERVEVLTAEPLENPAAELERRIQQTLTVANALEASRLEREKARAGARAEIAEAQARAQPQVEYQERYVNPPYLLGTTYNHRFDGPWRGHHPPRFDKRRHDDGRHRRGDRDDHRRGERTRSRAFPYDPD